MSGVILGTLREEGASTRSVLPSTTGDLISGKTILAQFSPDTWPTSWLTAHVLKLLKIRSADPAKTAGFRKREHGCLSLTHFEPRFSAAGTARCWETFRTESAARTIE